MTSRRVLPGAVLLMCGLGALTGCCHHPSAAGVTVPVAPDSLRGVVAIAGTAFEQRIVLRSGESTVALAASAVDSAALSRSGGAEIMVRGRSEASTFRVASFAVERVDGAPVVDGVITRDGEHLVLATATRRILLGNPPVAFQGMIGARVWVGGPLDTGPNNYGVIRPAP